MADDITEVKVPDALRSVSVSAHPRARGAVRRTRCAAALIGLLVGSFVGLQRWEDPFAAGCTGLAFGVVCCLAGWWGAVVVWQMALKVQIDERRQQTLDELRRRNGEDGSA